MRLTALIIAGFVALAACERPTQDVEPAAPAINAVSTTVSDELPGLTAPATGIAFWEHPTLTFNGVMIVATGEGVVSYNMEDGNEVSRIDGIAAAGAAVGYAGFGPAAAGFLAFFDEADSLFRFYGVDNASRAFLPLQDGPAIRGAVRGFCLGRSPGAAAPVLFVVQNAKVQFFNLAAGAEGIGVESEGVIDTPDNMASCAVDPGGVLLLGADDGAIYRLDGPDAFQAPFAKASIAKAGEMALLQSAAPDNDSTQASAQILFFDESDGALHVFNAADGATLGVVSIDGTDQLPGVSAADVFAATPGNLGGLYRDGVAAFGVSDAPDGPVIRLAPVGGIANALSLEIGDPVSLRGRAPEADDTGLIIPDIATPE